MEKRGKRAGGSPDEHLRNREAVIGTSTEHRLRCGGDRRRPSEGPRRVGVSRRVAAAARVGPGDAATMNAPVHLSSDP
ncbi:unnamed protein product, partial [Iphiclides podalirius]